MSNKIVPNVYRTIIDDVVANVRADFDEFGIEENLLALLQQKWEHKLLASNVAPFEQSAPATTGTSSGFGQIPQQWTGGLKGGGEGRLEDVKGKGPARLRGGGGQEDQYNVVSDSDDDSDSATSSIGDSSPAKSTLPPPASSSTGPVDSKPVLPSGPTARPQANEFGIFPGDEQINSDLDDSDDELDDQEQDIAADPDADIVFCVYDKVNRVKNKWKMVFRDGMAKVNGKDYLFAKATCDVEW